MKRLLYFFRNSVRGRLALLVVGIAGPAAVLVGLLVLRAYQNEQVAVGTHLAATARALATLVDHHLEADEALLRGLAQSTELERDDYAAFGIRARGLVNDADRWVILSNPDGQQLVNTRVPAGSSLPRLPLDAEFTSAMQAGRPFVSNVVMSPVTQSHVLYVAHPLMRDGQLRHVLALAMVPSALARALKVEWHAPGTTIAIVDREGTIAARNPNGGRYTGAKARPDIVEMVKTSTEGIRESTTLEGVRVIAVHSRAPRSGWSVALGAPYAAILASARQLLWLGLLLSGGLMLLAVVIAAWIGRALVRSVDALVLDTETIGRGDIPAAGSSHLAETDFVAEAMRKTARQLHERGRENVRLTATLQAEFAKLKRAEEATRRLAAIVESSDDAIMSKSLEGLLTSWNEGAFRIFGYRAEEMLGQPMARLVPPDRQSEEPAIIERIRRGERIDHFETLRRRKDGRLVPVSLTISPLRDERGVVVGASSIARDISARTRSLAQQHAIYELAAGVNRAEALPEIYEAALTAICRVQGADRAAILLSDAAGVMRFTARRGLSEAYCRAVEGHSPWPANAPNPAPVWIDDVRLASMAPQLREALDSEGIRALAFIPLTYEKRLLGKFMIYFNAPHAFVAADLRPVEAMSAQVAFAIERQRSADALEALVEERTASLRQAIAQMEEFSYSVSHDLRSPVRAMCGFAEAILQDHSDQLDERGRQLLTRILRNGSRMDRLIQDLLTYSRITRREISFEPVSLEKLLREVVQQYPDLRPERVDIEVQGPLPDVIAHEPSLTQVVSNLLSNAVKFMPPAARPRIRIGFDRKLHRVRLWFADNGIGIKPEYQSRLFAMFERVHPDKNFEGTGIGLAIVRKAVERMNGQVGVESDGISGSTFWFELPVAEKSRGDAGDSPGEVALAPRGQGSSV